MSLICYNLRQQKQLKCFHLAYFATAKNILGSFASGGNIFVTFHFFGVLTTERLVTVSCVCAGGKS